jgi:TATA-box binding protein (TBP) (component of TFIID and TFIIIB)
MIVNTTATVKFNFSFDLPNLSKSEYVVKPKGQDFKAVILKSMGLTFLIYQNGKCVILGGKDDLERDLGVRWLELETGNDCNDEIVVHNIVYSWDVQRRIKLEDLYNRILDTYPNQHVGTLDYPSLIFQEPGFKTKALLYSSGKIIITGSSTMDGIDRMMNKLSHLLGLDEGLKGT